MASYVTEPDIIKQKLHRTTNLYLSQTTVYVLSVLLLLIFSL